MDNFISLNIKYLRNSEFLDQKEFGNLFDVTRDVVSTYERGKAVPPVSVMQQICAYFHIKIDDLINTNLQEKNTLQSYNIEEPKPAYGEDVAFYKKALEDKEKIIKLLEDKINQLTKSSKKAG